MSEEIILKNSFLGGYKKNDVIEYVDAIVEKKEKRIKDLQEQIEFLSKENKKLKTDLKENKETKASSENIVTGNINTYMDNQILFSQLVANDAENLSEISIRQQMELPEGTYVVSEGNRVITLPDPQPVYKTKDRNALLYNVTDSKEDTLFKTLTAEDKPAKNTLESAEQNQKAKLTKEAKFTDEPKNGCANDMVKPVEVTLVVKPAEVGKVNNEPENSKNRESSGSYEKTLEQKLSVLKEQFLREEITKLESELLKVRELLEKEKLEKQILASKLEFSSELLLQLYKNR